MKRYWIVGSTVTMIGLLTFIGLQLVQQRSSALEKAANYADWSPNASAIRKTIGPHDPANPGKFNDSRHQQFAQLFQKRFRAHDPDPMAVGMHFENDKMIKLMCPARLEPWKLDSLAMAVWNEAHEDFGQTMSVDIYATYIGAPPVKIGTLRPRADNPQFASISYKYPHFSGHQQ